MTAQPLKAIVLDLLQQGHLAEEAFVQELAETERAAIGPPQLWPAKDHLGLNTSVIPRFGGIQMRAVSKR